MAALCIPVAQGVPGAAGPPDWWRSGDTQLDPLRKLRDDPRWRGATRIGIPGSGVGTGDLATFRALRSEEQGTKYLYLAFHLYQDLQLHPQLDRVWLGFHRPNGKAYVIRIATGPQPAQFVPDPVGDVVTWESTGSPPLGPLAVGAPVNGGPAWLTDTARAWIRPGEWAIHVRVPLTDPNGPNVGLAHGVEDGSRFAFLLQDWVSSASGVVPYALPAPDQVSGFNSSNWSEILPEGDPGCQGITFELFHLDANNQMVWHVGTDNNPSSKINAGQANTFFAMPTNRANAPVPVIAPDPNDPTNPNNRLTARFRIANWGSIITGLTGPWQQIIPDPNNAAALPITNTSPIPPTPATGPTQRLQGTWQAPAATSGTPNPNHQCVLVELAGPFPFLSDSVVRNMDIVPASRFGRDAEISVKGLEPLPEGQRDVYLYVDAKNLPPRVADERPEEGDEDPRRGAAGGHGIEEGEFPPPDPVTIDDAAAARPAYRVYVFHDSGARWQFDDEAAAILGPQPSFGYFIEHAGRLYGWEHRLEGQGLQEIAPNLYRLAIDNNGSRTVRTEITSHERKPAWWRVGCLQTVVAGLGAVGTAGVVLLRFTRR